MDVDVDSSKTNSNSEDSKSDKEKSKRKLYVGSQALNYRRDLMEVFFIIFSSFDLLYEKKCGVVNELQVYIFSDSTRSCHRSKMV